MKNKLLLSLVAVSFVVLPNLSLAESDASTSTREKENNRAKEVQTIRDEINTRKENLKQEMASRTDAVKNSVTERRENALGKIVDKINQFTNTINNRYEAAVNRLDNLRSRIESRIAKMETSGVDVSKAKTLLATAKAKIEIARAGVADIASTTSNTTFGTTTDSIREEYKNIKDRMEKTKEDIKTAQAALVDVVENLKPGYNKLKNNTASTTATTTKND